MLPIFQNIHEYNAVLSRSPSPSRYCFMFERERDRENQRNREIERDFYILKVHLGDSNRQPQSSRENLE